MSDESRIDPRAALERYDRAMTLTDAVVASVPAVRWMTPSPCAGWTARDVLAHLLWGQALLACWAVGDRAPSPEQDWTSGCSDAELPRVWTVARQATREALTPSALSRVVDTRGFGAIRLAQFVFTFPFDSLLHTWDIAQAGNTDFALPEDVAADLLAWAETQESLLRRPGGLGAPIELTGRSTAVDRLLAFAGRRT